MGKGSTDKVDMAIYFEVMGYEMPNAVSTNFGDYEMRGDIPDEEFLELMDIPYYTTNIWSDYEVLEKVRSTWKDVDKLEHYMAYLIQTWMQRAIQAGFPSKRPSASVMWYKVGDYSRTAYHVLHPADSAGDIIGDEEA